MLKYVICFGGPGVSDFYLTDEGKPAKDIEMAQKFDTEKAAEEKAVEWYFEAFSDKPEIGYSIDPVSI